METITLNIYSIKELKEDCVKKAYSEWLGYNEYNNHHNNMDTLEIFCQHFDIECRNWEYNYYTFNYYLHIKNEEMEDLQGNRLYRLISNLIYASKKQKTYYKITKDGRTVTRKSKIIYYEECSFGGYYLDDVLADPFLVYLKKPEKIITYYDLCKTALDNFFNACVEDYNYCSSLEYFMEESENNEEKYFINGDKFLKAYA